MATSAVQAAGALIWREHKQTLEVLLVHRPRYKDWSFPKGKLEPAEALPACAVREVAEETGVQIALGQPLTTQHYRLPDGGRKIVHYWVGQTLAKPAAALRARPDTVPASRKEIDQMRWFSARQARKQLTHANDRNLLGELVDLWEDDKLETWTLVLVRHARAVKRSVWNRKSRSAEENEATRPLTHDQGRLRAKALVPILSAYGVGRVISSPWKRCYDTVLPYAQAAGVRVLTRSALTEFAHAAHPEAVRKAVAQALRAHDCALAVCTHRPVLPTVMAVVARHAPGKLLRSLPQQDPWLKTGEIMVIHMAHRRHGKIRAVAIERQRPLLK